MSTDVVSHSEVEKWGHLMTVRSDLRDTCISLAKKFIDFLKDIYEYLSTLLDSPVDFLFPFYLLVQAVS